RIAFGADLIGRPPGTRLWLGDTATDTTEPITVGSGNEYEPAVSPNGLRIAFTSEASHYDLVELPLDGSPVRDRLSSARDEADPSRAPRGGRFAYVTDRRGPQEIWISSDDGTIEKPVVTSATFQDGKTFLLSRVAFAPDGQRLA